MVKKTVDELGNIDILINNAGIVIWDPLLEAEEDTKNKIIDINQLIRNYNLWYYFKLIEGEVHNGHCW
jgi:NADP-dependent 3-hydroxy acid dehydrogenase YdfG